MKNKKSKQRTIRIYDVEVTSPDGQVGHKYLVLAQNKRMAKLQLTLDKGCKTNFIPITSSRPSQEDGWGFLTQNKLRILFREGTLLYDSVAL